MTEEILQEKWADILDENGLTIREAASIFSLRSDVLFKYVTLQWRPKKNAGKMQEVMKKISGGGYEDSLPSVFWLRYA